MCCRRVGEGVVGAVVRVGVIVVVRVVECVVGEGVVEPKSDSRSPSERILASSCHVLWSAIRSVFVLVRIFWEKTRLFIGNISC